MLDAIGRMSRSDHGTEIIMSISTDYQAFMAWLEDRLQSGRNVGWTSR
ncbi:hypothetical protein AB0F43_24445 [Kribbella sp. NPDC023972]